MKRALKGISCRRACLRTTTLHASNAAAKSAALFSFLNVREPITSDDSNGSHALICVASASMQSLALMIVVLAAFAYTLASFEAFQFRHVHPLDVR